MSNENEIETMLKLLTINNIYSTEEFKKDLLKLVNTNVKKFVKNFYRDIRRRNIEQYNRFEKLKLTKKQKEILEGNDLYRYEYRNDSNLRCIYIINNDNNNSNDNKTILLNAFNEDGDKFKGKKSYKDNIDRAIRIYLNIIKI